MNASIQQLSQEELEELIRLIRNDLALLIAPNKTSTIYEAPDTPMKAYARQAKINVMARKKEEK